MTKVELRPAFTWTCEECGRDNFASTVVVSRDAVAAMSEPGELEALFGDDAPDSFEAVPDVVVCRHCRSEFATEEPDGDPVDA